MFTLNFRKEQKMMKTLSVWIPRNQLDLSMKLPIIGQLGPLAKPIMQLTQMLIWACTHAIPSIALLHISPTKTIRFSLKTTRFIATVRSLKINLIIAWSAEAQLPSIVQFNLKCHPCILVDNLSTIILCQFPKLANLL